MSISAVVAMAVSLLSGVAWHWGRTGLAQPGGVGSQRAYTVAWKYGPALATLAACLSLALQAGGAP